MKEKDMFILSARDLCSKEYPSDFMIWKKKAFEIIPDRLNISLQIPTNLISIGDSPLEMEATKELGQKFDKAIVKLVKLEECLTAQSMVKQADLLLLILQDLLLSTKNRNIDMKVVNREEVKK